MSVQPGGSSGLKSAMVRRRQPAVVANGAKGVTYLRGVRSATHSKSLLLGTEIRFSVP
jgi:hypothetical protein